MWGNGKIGCKKSWRCGWTTDAIRTQSTAMLNGMEETHQHRVDFLSPQFFLIYFSKTYTPFALRDICTRSWLDSFMTQPQSIGNVCGRDRGTGTTVSKETQQVKRYTVGTIRSE